MLGATDCANISHLMTTGELPFSLFFAYLLETAHLGSIPGQVCVEGRGLGLQLLYGRFVEAQVRDEVELDCVP